MIGDWLVVLYALTLRPFKRVSRLERRTIGSGAAWAIARRLA